MLLMGLVPSLPSLPMKVYCVTYGRPQCVACVEAEARCDKEEKRRLIKSCPKKTYVQTDLEFSESMEKLMVLAMAVEADLRGSALGYFVALRIEPKIAPKFLQEISDIRAAWETTVSEMGIDPEIMKLAGPPTSPILELIDGLVPAPDRKKAEKMAADMRKIIS